MHRRDRAPVCLCAPTSVTVPTSRIPWLEDALGAQEYCGEGHKAERLWDQTADGPANLLVHQRIFGFDRSHNESWQDSAEQHRKNPEELNRSNPYSSDIPQFSEEGVLKISGSQAAFKSWFSQPRCDQ